MENNQLNSPKSFEKGQGKDTNYKANIEYAETVIKVENIEPQRIIILANLVWIKDDKGNIRQTEQGKQYKVNIENGQISFDEPLKFKNNG